MSKSQITGILVASLCLLPNARSEAGTFFLQEASTFVERAAPKGEGDAMEIGVKAEREVIELHAFFEDWFLGKPGIDISRLENCLSEDFDMVTPAGKVVEKVPLVERLRGAFGSWKSSQKRIEIRNLETLPIDGDWIIVRYEEWHLAGEVADSGRLSTAIFRSKNGTPLGVEWVRLQETWLPGD